MTQNDKVQSYFDALIQGAETVRAAIEQSADRTSKFSKQTTAEIAAAQREALELSKKLAAAPTDATGAYAALMEAAVAAQSRALRVGKLAYEHAAGSGADAQQSLEQLTNAGRETAEAAAALSQDWGSFGSAADAWRKSVEAFVPATAPVAKAAK